MILFCVYEQKGDNSCRRYFSEKTVLLMVWFVVQYYKHNSFFGVENCTCISKLLIDIHCCIFALYIDTISTLMRLYTSFLLYIPVLSAWLCFRALSISLILWYSSSEVHLQNTLPIFLMAFSALPASVDGRDLKLFYHGKSLLQFISFFLSNFPLCRFN